MLQFKDVSFAVGEKTILKNINLEIDDRFVAITGPNGSGKSTLAKHFNSILLPCGGKVYVNVIVYRNKVIGGDVCSASIGGFIHGFEKSA